MSLGLAVDRYELIGLGRFLYCLESLLLKLFCCCCFFSFGINDLGKKSEQNHRPCFPMCKHEFSSH